jgi:hypothetical protein
MAFDPTEFCRMVVADTCSVWNILSAKKLYGASRGAHVTFCVTPMVLYECLQKPRKVLTPEMTTLIDRLLAARAQGSFPIQACDLEDLLALSQGAPVGLSSGELSCIATAMKMRTLAFMTDEKKARHHAKERLNLRVETTPRLYGWLHFHRHLDDGDHLEIIREHEVHERRPLTKFFQEAYESALQYRLMARST